jgi:hypothetical protein
MERMIMKFIMALLLCLVASCNAQDRVATNQVGNERSAANIAKRNHSFTRIDLVYQEAGCSFDTSPVDFCDENHMRLINNAIKQQQPNFNQHYILLTIAVWPEYHQRSVVAINTKTGVVYPLPIDVYSGPLDKAGNPRKDGKITFSLNSKQVCIDGAILAYRSVKEGKFCFSMLDNKFVGHHTPYMN